MARTSYREALRAAHRDAMQRDERVFVGRPSRASHEYRKNIVDQSLFLR